MQAAPCCWMKSRICGFGHRGGVVELVVGDDVSGVERLPGAGRGADRATPVAGCGGGDLGAVAEADGQHQDEHDPGHQQPGAAAAEQQHRLDAGLAGGEAPAGERRGPSATHRRHVDPPQPVLTPDDVLPPLDPELPCVPALSGR